MTEIIDLTEEITNLFRLICVFVDSGGAFDVYNLCQQNDAVFFFEIMWSVNIEINECTKMTFSTGACFVYQYRMCKICKDQNRVVVDM